MHNFSACLIFFPREVSQADLATSKGCCPVSLAS